MDKTVNIHTAKTTLSKLVAEVENGEEIVIARSGKPVAKLVPVKGKAKAKRKSQVKPRVDREPGFMKGQIWIGPDFDGLLPDDVMKAFRGEGD